MFGRQLVEGEGEAESWGEEGGGWRAGKGDCLKERQDANTEARGGNEAAYVPECAADGKFIIN